MSRVCQETMQSNIFDYNQVPHYLAGMYAPLAVWEYMFALQRRVEKLERELAAVGREE